MTRPITVYGATDGSRWDAEEDAIARDDLCRVVDEAMAPLGPRHRSPEGQGCTYESGEGYVQHDPDAVLAAKRALLPITRKVIGWWFDGQMQNHGKRYPDDFMGIHPSWYCRFIEDGPVCVAWQRLQCIDKQGREWGQPFYAEHPEEAQHFEIKREA